MKFTKHGISWFVEGLFGVVASLIASPFILLTCLWLSSYRWDKRVPSPDGQYDLILLGGSMSALDDTSYRIYVFPHASTPADRPEGTQVLLTPFWISRKYLIYSGGGTPMFRWTGSRTIELDLTDLRTPGCTFEPIKHFGQPEDASILVSLMFDKTDNTNILP